MKLCKTWAVTYCRRLVTTCFVLMAIILPSQVRTNTVRFQERAQKHIFYVLNVLKYIILTHLAAIWSGHHQVVYKSIQRKCGLGRGLYNYI